MSKTTSYVGLVGTFLILSILIPSSLTAQVEEYTEESEYTVLREDSLTAQCVGFVAGDFQYAGVCVSRDSILLLRCDNLPAKYFVAANIGAKLNINYQLVRSLIYVGEVVTTEVLSSAKLGSYGSSQWWKDVTRAMGRRRAEAAFDALVDSLTLERSEDFNCD